LFKKNPEEIIEKTFIGSRENQRDAGRIKVEAFAADFDLTP
jgi:hypothetical protein